MIFAKDWPHGVNKDHSIISPKFFYCSSIPQEILMMGKIGILHGDRQGPKEALELRMYL